MKQIISNAERVRSRKKRGAWEVEDEDEEKVGRRMFVKS